MKGEKIYTLMYADDIALMAEEEQDMRSMIGRLEGQEGANLEYRENKNNEIQKRWRKEEKV